MSKPQRRPLTAGLSAVPPGVDPDAVKAFITQERPVESKVEVDEERPQVAAAFAQPRPEPAQNGVREEKPSRRKRGKRAAIPTGLVAVTVRLKPEIAAALKRASLERQLAGEETYTQQDLVEEALEPWLHDEGYL